MNHITRIITFFALLVIIGIGALPAQEKNNWFTDNYSFSLSTGIGLLYGTSYEIVYKDAYKDDYLSELQWDIKPVYYGVINFDLGQKNPSEGFGFFGGIELEIALPMKTGEMEDRDWKSDVNPPGSLTHFSSHNNHTIAAISAGLNTGVSLPVWKFILRFYLNFDYLFFKWEAKDGYTQYGKNNTEYGPYTPWNPDFSKSPSPGLGISYTQHWFLLNTGIGAAIPLGRFTLAFDFFIGPSICVSIDIHHKRDLKFIDYLYKGISIEPKLTGSFSFNDHFSISLSASYRYIGETRGNTETINESSGIIYNTAGASLKIFDGSLSIIYKF